MSREIKFRAWDKNGKYMFYDIQNGIEFSDLSHYTFKDFLGNSDAVEDCHDWILMQYTGFKDKNEKEIYEGDILKSKHGTTNGYSFQHVLWGENDGAFYVEFNSSWYSLVCLLRSGMGHTVEVIGNIYENPKLLK